MIQKGWKKGNKRGTYYYNKCGDEIRITHGSYYGKSVYNVMYRKHGSYWMKYSHYENITQARKNALSFMKKETCK